MRQPFGFARQAMVRHRHIMLVAVIGIGASAMRLWGSDVGLPWVDHPDEPNPVGYVLAMVSTGDLNPHAFQKPSLYLYLLLAAVRLGAWWSGTSPLTEPLTTHIYTTVPWVFLWGRTLTALLGGLTVVLAGLVAQRAGPLAAIGAAAWLAVARYHLQHSQYITTDVAAGLFVMVACAAALRIARTGEWPAYLLGGLAVGLAASTKYHAAAVAPMVALAHVLVWRRAAPRRAARLLAAGALACLGFVAGTPYALLSVAEFRDGLLGQVAAYNAGPQGDFSGSWNLAGYAEFAWRSGLTPMGSMVLLAGLAWAWRNDRTLFAVWLAGVVPSLALLAAQETHFTRNTIPLLALAAVPIGCALAQVPRLVRRPALAAVAIMLILTPGAFETGAYLQRLAAGDTRTQLAQWLEQHVSPGQRVLAELHVPPARGEGRWAGVDALTDHDLAWYRAQGYAYLIASSERWRSWDVPAAYAALGTPLVAFGGATPRAMFGPRLLVYDTGLAAGAVPLPLMEPARVGGAILLGVALGVPDARAPGSGLVPGVPSAEGGTLGLRTFWQVDAPFDGDYFIFVHIVDAAGQRVAQRDAPPWLGSAPTSAWRAGALVVDHNDVALPALPPGEYRVLVGMFDPQRGGHPPTTVGGVAVAPALEVARIVIR